MKDLIKDIKTLLSIKSKHSDLLVETLIDAYVKERIDRVPIHIENGVENTRVYVKDGAIVCEPNDELGRGSDTFALDGRNHTNNLKTKTNE